MFSRIIQTATKDNVLTSNGGLNLIESYNQVTKREGVGIDEVESMVTRVKFGGVHPCDTHKAGMFVEELEAKTMASARSIQRTGLRLMCQGAVFGVFGWIFADWKQKESRLRFEREVERDEYWDIGCVDTGATWEFADFVIVGGSGLLFAVGVLMIMDGMGIKKNAPKVIAALRSAMKLG